MQNIAIILSGGIGSRMGDTIPKQFFKVAGKTVLEHTVDTFELNKNIDEIAIVINPLYISTLENMQISNKWIKVKKILNGGKERYESSLSAISAYSNLKECNFIFHDAVRPLVTQRIIDDVINALKSYNAVDVAIPATDTIIQTDSEGKLISNIPDRRFLQRGQTPQGFKLSIISKAYQIALRDLNFVATDDCGIVLKYLPNEKIYVVQGEESNMKLTHKEDAFLLDKLFQLKSYPISNQFDFSMLQNKTIVIFGGNSGIGEKIAEIAIQQQSNVFVFSRTTTGTNIANRHMVKKALEDVFLKTGRIDFIVNTAAILIKEPLITTSEENIENIIETNYKGMINIAIESFELLKKTQGQLLLYTSSSYTRGRAFYSLYSSTKAAVVNFMQALSQEWEPFGIKVNCVNPERTKTPMRIQNFGNEPEDSLLNPTTVARASIGVLLSDYTGQVIDVKKMDKN